MKNYVLITIAVLFAGRAAAQTDLHFEDFWKEVDMRYKNDLISSGLHSWIYKVSQSISGNSYSDALERLEKIDKDKLLQDKVLLTAFVENYPDKEGMRFILGNLCGSFKLGNGIADYMFDKYSNDRSIIAPLLVKIEAARIQHEKDSIEAMQVQADEIKQKEQEEENRIYKAVEQMPAFKSSFDQFINEHLRYPKNAADNGIHGRVIVQFTIAKDGHIKDIMVIRGIGGGCDEEAKRVIALTDGLWTPGQQAGKPVNVYLTKPINFTLN